MKLKRIEEKEHGRFIHRYDLHYETPSGEEYTYEMISRNPHMDTEEKLKNPRADAVIMIITDKENEHILIEREFRMDLGQEIYGFPGGLIEPEETPEECAARELLEETGLRLTEIRQVMPAAYCSVGLSNELTICVFGTAEGSICPDATAVEEICPAWYTREEVLKLYGLKRFGSWCLAYSWIWANEAFPG